MNQLIQQFFDFPMPFYLVIVVYALAALRFWQARHQGFGIPGLAVLTTMMVWYVGDALYNDYSVIAETMSPETLDNAWWQVLLFEVVFIAGLPAINQFMNHRFRATSIAMKYVDHDFISSDQSQRQIGFLFRMLATGWGVLMVIALYRVNWDVLGLFAPWLGHRVEPWGRNRIGGGLDALYSLAGYLQIFLTAGFAVIAGISRSRQIRTFAILICIVAMPYFLFGRNRNTMLAVAMPGFVAWLFVGLRVSLPVKVVIVAVALTTVNWWFLVVLDARSNRGMAQAISSGAAFEAEGISARHRGLDMFSELANINSFIENGVYKPNWGQRYFAEIVNPVPRSLWPGKPTIGMDYAIARGFGGGSEASGGVTTSISTGLIGQGVVNFGRVGGPIAAALICCFWAAMIARQDYLSDQPGRMLLYAIGLILTFNIGRDFTLLVIYPFLFGWVAVIYFERMQKADSV